MNSPKPGFGQLGPNVSSALKSDFFTFFHLRQAESEVGDERTAITYKPGAPQFRDLVTVVLTVDTKQNIIGAQLALNRRFIVDPMNGVFANDIAKSFLLACINDSGDYPELLDAAAAIRRPSKDKLENCACLRVYAGMQDRWSLAIPAGHLRLLNTSEGSEEWLVLTAGGEANKEPEAIARVGEILRQLKTAKQAHRVKLCKEGLELLDPDRDAEVRAALHGMLAEALMAGEPGAHGRNLDEAIDSYRAALRYYSSEQEQTAWINLTQRLVEAYRKRAQVKNKSTDLQEVIACEEQLLAVLPRDHQWAELSEQLAADYENRNQGSTSKNRRKAMRHYAAALAVWRSITRGGVGLEAAAKLAELANQTKDAEARKFQRQAVEWMEAFLEYQRQRTNPAERAAAIEELRAATGAIPADPKPDVQQALQRMLPFIMLSNILENLAHQYIRNPGHDEAAAQERAIAALEEALEQIPADADAVANLWSRRARFLAGLYQTRRQGERSRNFERGFALYQQALNSAILYIDTEMWVRLLLDFSDAYVVRKESRADRLDSLIDWLQEAMELPAVAEDALQRARVRRALGHANLVHPTGNRGDRVEQAIGFYRAGLTDLEGLDDTALRAGLCNDLGIAFAQRTKGDRVENREEAIAHLEEAVRLWDPKTARSLWASASMNLGIVYSQRQRGERVANLDRSLECFQQTLKVVTKKSDALFWATVMHNIGNLYLRSRDVDHGASIEFAKEAYENALTVRTAENVPNDWAVTMANLGNTYLNRVKGNRTENYEKGIECCVAALTIRTRETNPYEWAETLNHLGNLHHSLYEMKRQDPGNGWVEHFDQARQAYAGALEVMTPEADAARCIPLARSLAGLYTAERRWRESLDPFRQAIRAADNLYRASILRTTREIQLEHIGDLFRRAAYAMAEAGEAREAVCTLERGRARGLSESLALDRTDLSRVESQDAEALAAYVKAAARLREVAEADRQATLAEAGAPDRDQLRSVAQNAHKELETALDRIRRIAGFENFLLPVSWEEICEQVQPGVPVVYISASPRGAQTAFLARNSMTEEVVLETLVYPPFGEAELYSLISGNSGESPGWMTAYMARGKSASVWRSTLDRVCGEIWAPIVQPVMEKILKFGAEEVVVIPCGLFEFLPLHAAWNGDGAERVYALDLAAFRYAPSASVLAASRRAAAAVKPDALLAVAEPSSVQGAGPLPNAEGEVGRIAALFENKTVLAHSQATLGAVLEMLPKVQVAHFACHGGTDWQEPLRSSLLMARDEPLPVADLLRLRLNGARLAALSACETGIVGSRLPDEVVSLSSALLQAGFAGVIASMWSAFDLSTALLMPQIYQFWIQDGVAPHQALRKAVKWLREQTAADLAKSFAVTRAHAANKGGEDYEQASEAWQHFAYDYAPEDRPYAHAVFWAAFIYTGA
jgi:CHAT domain-containing protein/tetratricopeptide (TPR) repeat protein